MDEIKIEKGVPMGRSRFEAKKYPLFEMEVGDSFIVPSKVKQAAAYGISRQANQIAILAGKPHRFKTGKVSDGIYRVWRVA